MERPRGVAFVSAAITEWSKNRENNPQTKCLFTCISAMRLLSRESPENGPRRFLVFTDAFIPAQHTFLGPTRVVRCIPAAQGD
jgi:hypothetical protein